MPERKAPGRRRPGKSCFLIDLMLVQAELPNSPVKSPHPVMLTLASYLRKKLFRVRVLTPPDMLSLSGRGLREQVRLLRPSAVWFYLSPGNCDYALEIAQILKREEDEILIIGGGPEASRGRELLRSYPFLDCVVPDEGEIPMEYLLASNRNNIRPEEKPGLYLNKEGDPEMEMADYPENLMSPSYTYFTHQNRFPVFTGRGGTLLPEKTRKIHLRPAGEVAEEIITNLEEHPFQGFDFQDNFLMLDASRCVEIMRYLRDYREKRGREFFFTCRGPVNLPAVHPEIIKPMIDAGLVHMILDIYSGEQLIRQRYGVSCSNREIRDMVQLVAEEMKTGITGIFIPGGIGENEETFEASKELAVELTETAPGLFEAEAEYLSAFPGSPLWNTPEKFDLQALPDEALRCNPGRDVRYVTRRFSSPGEIRNLVRDFNETVRDTMERVLGIIPESVLESHYAWASPESFVRHSAWYTKFLVNLFTVGQFFEFQKSPRFRRLRDIPPDELLRWFPLRVTEDRQYHPGNKMVLPPAIRRVILESPQDQKTYELCFGKMNIGEVAHRIQLEFYPDISRESVLEEHVLPFLGEMEELYQVTFHE